jgi:hypothetical protein
VWVPYFWSSTFYLIYLLDEQIMSQPLPWGPTKFIGTGNNDENFKTKANETEIEIDNDKRSCQNSTFFLLLDRNIKLKCYNFVDLISGIFPRSSIPVTIIDIYYWNGNRCLINLIILPTHSGSNLPEMHNLAHFRGWFQFFKLFNKYKNHTDEGWKWGGKRIKSKFKLI